jgi:hypothetical protein
VKADSFATRHDTLIKLSTNQSINVTGHILRFA